MTVDAELDHVSQQNQEKTAILRDRQLLLCIACVGGHSIILGLFIFFFTEAFYRLFFGADIANYFFVKQSGLFLLCLGLFYLVPLLDLKRHHFLMVVIVVTKILAVGFLLLHTHHTPRPMIILLAAFIDASMATALIYYFIKSRLF